jgi:hypothetical protein
VTESHSAEPHSAEPRGEVGRGPEDAAPDLHADESRPGSPPADVDPGVIPAQGTSEELEPVQGVHVPEIDEDGPIAPGRYRTEGAGGDAVERATDDAPKP